MKLIDFLRTAPVEKIAEKVYLRGNEGYKINDWRFGFDHSSEFFVEEAQCPEDCDYLEEGWRYDHLTNALCGLEDDEVCPYSIDRVQVQRQQFIDWLNSEIDVEES